MSDDKAIREFRSLLAALLALRLTLTCVTVWGFLWGMGVLILRAAVGVPRGPLAWGLAGMLPAVAVGIILSRRQLPRPAQVRALLDRQSHCGGLYMAAEEVDLGQWQRRMPPVSVPDLGWRGGRAWGLLAAALVFVIIGFLVPQRLVLINPGHTLEVDEQIAKLTGQIELLKEENVIEPSKAEVLQEKLAQIRNEALGEDPVKTWEALDHIEAMPKQAAEEAAEAAISETEELTKAEALAEALSEALENASGGSGAEGMDPERMAEAMAELAQMVKEAAKENEQLERRLNSRELVKACERGEISAAQLKEMADSLRLSKDELAELLKRLNEGELIDIETLDLNAELGECDADGLARFLAENPGNMSVGELVDLWNGGLLGGEGPGQDNGDGLPGRGGVSRGRADASMTWGDESSDEGAKFKEIVLPPAAVGKIKESIVAGVSKGAPTIETGGPSEPGALSGAATGSGSAHTHTVLPRHRGAVRRYFERK